MATILAFFAGIFLPHWILCLVALTLGVLMWAILIHAVDWGEVWEDEDLAHAVIILFVVASAVWAAIAARTGEYLLGEASNAIPDPTVFWSFFWWWAGGLTINLAYIASHKVFNLLRGWTGGAIGAAKSLWNRLAVWRKGRQEEKKVQELQDPANIFKRAEVGVKKARDILIQAASANNDQILVEKAAEYDSRLRQLKVMLEGLAVIQAATITAGGGDDPVAKIITENEKIFSDVKMGQPESITDRKKEFVQMAQFIRELKRQIEILATDCETLPFEAGKLAAQEVVESLRLHSGSGEVDVKDGLVPDAATLPVDDPADQLDAVLTSNRKKPKIRE